jgi:hypothetical protein
MNTTHVRLEWHTPILVDLSAAHTRSGDVAPVETTQTPGGGTGFAFGPPTTTTTPGS